MENGLRGCDERVFVIAELGINHGGNLATAFQMIDAAKWAGADAVKFQKRTVDVVYSEDELAQPRESPFGATNRDLKEGLEFGADEYYRIDGYCKEAGIPWFASPWNVGSVAFLQIHECPAYKVASACLTDAPLLAEIRDTGKPVIMSTGMSTGEQVTQAIDNLTPCAWLALLVTTAAYPCPVDQLHLERIPALIESGLGRIGYSGHEVGLWTTLCAVAMGARIVERHFTLDRSMWGSDQSASVEPRGFKKLVDEIRTFDKARGSDRIRLLDCEKPAMEKLRRFK